MVLGYQVSTQRGLGLFLCIVGVWGHTHSWCMGPHSQFLENQWSPDRPQFPAAARSGVPSLPLDMAPLQHPCQLSCNGPNLFSSVAMPLQRPWEGPFEVIESGPKTFKVDIGGRREIITIDRLKLAHLDVDSPIQVAQPRPWGPPNKQGPAPLSVHVPPPSTFLHYWRPSNSPA